MIIYLHAKDQYKAKCQFLIKKRESAGLKHLNDSDAFIEYSNMDDIYKNLEEYNSPLLSCNQRQRIKKAELCIFTSQ